MSGQRKTSRRRLSRRKDDLALAFAPSACLIGRDADATCKLLRSLARSGTARARSRCRFGMQMFVEELFHRFVEIEFVFFVMKTVAFVLLDHVFHIDASLLQSIYDLI